jgi:hypothetical protein
MTKPEIIILLRAVFADTQRVIATQDNQKCFEPEGEKWSIAQHLQHLIMSAAPVASIYKQPKEFLLSFGQPTMGPRGYDEVVETYQKVLAKGLKAPAAFEPKLDNISKVSDLFPNWQMIISKFEERLANWTEEDLDQYRVPHPAIGLLSLWEMLYFTIYHTKHHLKSIQRIIK